MAHYYLRNSSDSECFAVLYYIPTVGRHGKLRAVFNLIILVSVVVCNAWFLWQYLKVSLFQCPMQ